MCDKLTAYARQVSENGSVYVECDDNDVIWLRKWSHECNDYRTLMAVGVVGAKVTHIRQNIDGYFADR